MHQTAEDNAPNDQIKEIVKESFYVDDLFHGGDSVEECQIQIEQIIETLEAGKLPLTKWVASDPEILANIDPSKKMAAYSDKSKVKTLGIQYDPHDDFFGFQFKAFEKLKYTKRGILSVAAALYDPIGWLLPVIIWFRILIQRLLGTKTRLG